MIPTSIAGVSFITESFQWAAGSADTLTPLLGKRPENVCYAYGMTADPKKFAAGIEVYRIVGVSAERLRAAIAQAWNGLSTLPPVQTIGGKPVVVVEMTGSAMVCCSNGPEYLYAHGEALFVVLPADPATATTVLKELP